MRMELILQGGDVWDVIDPSSEGVPKLTTPGQQLDDWVWRDKKALTQIKCYVSDTALLSLQIKSPHVMPGKPCQTVIMVLELRMHPSSP